MTDTKQQQQQVPTSGSSQYTDPTYNVLQTVNAAVQRLNDLAEAEKERNREVMRLNEKVLDLHISYGEKLSLAESKRIDAIRAVDVAAVAIASERQVQQASVLANQVSASAETLRNLVATTANATATQFQQVISPIVERIALLEKSKYEISGQSTNRQSNTAQSQWVVYIIIIVVMGIMGLVIKFL